MCHAGCRRWCALLVHHSRVRDTPYHRVRVHPLRDTPSHCAINHSGISGFWLGLWPGQKACQTPIRGSEFPYLEQNTPLFGGPLWAIWTPWTSSPVNLWDPDTLHRAVDLLQTRYVCQLAKWSRNAQSRGCQLRGQKSAKIGDFRHFSGQIPIYTGVSRGRLSLAPFGPEQGL